LAVHDGKVAQRCFGRYEAAEDRRCGEVGHAESTYPYTAERADDRDHRPGKRATAASARIALRSVLTAHADSVLKTLIARTC
jgi:hypothetical protein